MSSLGNILKSFENWHILNIEERKKILYELKKYGSVSKLDQKTKTKTQLLCPIHKQKILCNCKLAKCKFYVDYSWSKNCLLYYMEEHQKQKLQAEEISFLYKLPVSEVKTTIKKAFSFVRKELLDEYIEDQIHSGAIKPVFFPKECCVACGKKLAEDINMEFRLPSGYGWCSETCKTKKPKEVFEIEERFGVPYSKYLLYTQTLFREKIKEL